MDNTELVEMTETTLVIDGTSLDTVFNNPGQIMDDFFRLAIKAACVCICRCSPTQKAEVTQLLKGYTGGKRIAAIGDGGNDVGMILEADIGIGIVGKEGVQASLASDFSITGFSHLRRLVLWHGRNSYRRSAILS
jgi:phospholipid-translocating ATPase